MFIFKYIRFQIYRNGEFYKAFEDFVSENPEFPIVEGQYFEYRENGFDLINDEGHHLPQEDLLEYNDLISAINNLG